MTSPPALEEVLGEERAGPGWVKLAFFGAGGLALVAFPFVVTQPFLHRIMINIFLFGLMAQSWNILAGYCGHISLGHAVFFGLGAYSSGFLFTTYGLSPWLAMGVGVVVSMGVAGLIGLPTLRLKGHYFAIATLVIGESVQILFLRWDFFGAASGIWLPIIRESPWQNFQFHDTKVPYYFIALFFLLAACLAVRVMEGMRLGYYFRAIREDEDAASSLGVPVAIYKSLAFMISAGFMSVAGSFHTQFILVIDPETVFPQGTSIMVVLMTVLGGVGTLWGPVLGAAVLISVSEVTRIVWGGTGGAVDLMIYGALIVLISIFRPQGLLGARGGSLSSLLNPKKARR